MLNELRNFMNRYQMVRPGDRVICAVSGGPDSMALLWGMHLLRDALGIEVCAAHYNHGLRGAESDSDEAFVRDFCSFHDIPLTVGRGVVSSGKKGLEAAARDARYGFLQTLPGKIATAHTAEDNAETILMHLIRGTGLKGLGGISPVRGNLIRPMLTITREQVLAFLQENHIPWVEDSTNATDSFLRNRVRHHILPLFRQENPRIGENLSDMALQLRLDEQALEDMAQVSRPLRVSQLREMPPALRRRALGTFLKESGVPEPEMEHIFLAENLVFSDRPSAKADFPGGIIISRNYDVLESSVREEPIREMILNCPGVTELPELGLRIICREAEDLTQTKMHMTVKSVDNAVIRCRQPGDVIRISGGSKELKKLFIDRKIPAGQRLRIPVLADAHGILGVCGIGVNLNRAAKDLPAISIRFEKILPAGAGTQEKQ